MIVLLSRYFPTSHEKAMVGDPRDASGAGEFERAVVSHLDGLARLARFLLRGSQADVEDLVQDTLLRAYTAFPRFRPGTNVRAWLFRILRNAYVDRLRKHGREAEIVEAPSPAWEQAAAVEAFRAEAARAASEADLEAALGRLPGDSRLAVLLVDGEGLRYEEVAAIMDCPIGTVRSRVHRGRRLLRQHLLEAWRGRTAR